MQTGKSVRLLIKDVVWSSVRKPTYNSLPSVAIKDSLVQLLTDKTQTPILRSVSISVTDSIWVSVLVSINKITWN